MGVLLMRKVLAVYADLPAFCHDGHGLARCVSPDGPDKLYRQLHLWPIKATLLL